MNFYKLAYSKEVFKALEQLGNPYKVIQHGNLYKAFRIELQGRFARYEAKGVTFLGWENEYFLPMGNNEALLRRFTMPYGTAERFPIFSGDCGLLLCTNKVLKMPAEYWPIPNVAFEGALTCLLNEAQVFEDCTGAEIQGGHPKIIMEIDNGYDWYAVA